MLLINFSGLNTSGDAGRQKSGAGVSKMILTPSGSRRSALGCARVVAYTDGR